jgi:hypothetical protein
MKSIAFSDPLVLKIEEGLKTQTRRVLKEQPESSVTDVTNAATLSGISRVHRRTP